MKLRLLLPAALFSLLAACSGSTTSETPPDAERPADDGVEAPVPDTPEDAAPEETVETPAPESDVAAEELVASMRAAITELEARPEHDAKQIEVQHLLVGIRGSGIPGVTRTRDEAEQLAAEIWKKLRAGEEFAPLVKEHSNDSPEGIYTMTTVPGDVVPNQIYARRGMVPAFGNVGWRLEVGEYGVAPFDPAKSRYGWHRIKRLK